MLQGTNRELKTHLDLVTIERGRRNFYSVADYSKLKHCLWLQRRDTSIRATRIKQDTFLFQDRR